MRFSHSPIRRNLAVVSSGLFLGILGLTQACSSSDDGTAATGGLPGTGGNAISTGGTATGGTATGGTTNPTGGTATGGVATGGTTTGGTSTGGATGGSMTGGSTTGGANATGGQAGNTGGGGTSTGGSGNAGAAGSNAGAGGSAGTAGGGASGTGGAANTGGGGAAGGAGKSGTGGSAGAGGAGKTAVAMLMPTTGNQLTGTGTFTQNGQNVTLVIQVTNCPAGGHASHIHLNKNCGSNGDDAGGHWVPQGEVIPEITCAADGTGTATVTPTAGTWTIGSGTGDVTTHALMVHVGNNASPGGRMACGLINAQ
jgi:hypothetical protein